MDIEFRSLFEAIAHVDLSDMPDAGGTNTDHDARYFTESESDLRFLKLDQTTPQTVANGAPHFDGTVLDAPAIIFKIGRRVVYDGR